MIALDSPRVSRPGSKRRFRVCLDGIDPTHQRNRPSRVEVAGSTVDADTLFDESCFVVQVQIDQWDRNIPCSSLPL